MLLHTDPGKAKHLSTKQLWVQEAMPSYGVEVQTTLRAENASDVLIHVRIQRRPPEDEVPHCEGMVVGICDLAQVLGKTVRSCGSHGVSYWGCRHNFVEHKSCSCSGFSAHWWEGSVRQARVLAARTVTHFAFV